MIVYGSFHAYFLGVCFCSFLCLKTGRFEGRFFRQICLLSIPKTPGIFFDLLIFNFLLPDSTGLKSLSVFGGICLSKDVICLVYFGLCGNADAIRLFYVPIDACSVSLEWAL